MKEIRLSVPLKENDVRALDIGDVVFFNGLFYTCRTQFQARLLEQNIRPPLDFKELNLMIHVGPVMKNENGIWRPVSFDPTSSIRFEKYGPQIIPRLGIKAIIGKSTMGPATLKAMQEYGCVHLTRVGVCGNILASKIKRVVEVHGLEELGNTEATWVMEAEEFGPFIVDMDSKGNNYFSNVSSELETKIKNIYKQFGIPEDFQYTEI